MRAITKKTFPLFYKSYCGNVFYREGLPSFEFDVKDTQEIDNWIEENSYQKGFDCNGKFYGINVEGILNTVNISRKIEGTLPKGEGTLLYNVNIQVDYFYKTDKSVKDGHEIPSGLSNLLKSNGFKKKK